MFVKHMKKLCIWDRNSYLRDELQGTLPQKLNITTIHRQRRVGKLGGISGDWQQVLWHVTAEKVHTDMTTASPD